MLKIACVGDCIATTEPRKFYFKNNNIVELFSKCDIVSGNLEMVVSGNKAFASTYCGGEWIAIDENDFSILMKYGFDYLNTANNHTMDYSYDGLRYTNEILDKNSILHTGSGNDLNEAEKHVIKEVNGVKVAFISCTASCDDSSRAGYPTNSLPGRPGVNMLRHSEIIYATPEQLKIIDEIASDTCLNARFLKSVKMGINSLDPKIHRLGRVQFVESNNTEKRTYCNSNDLKRIVKNIKKAKNEGADFIIMNAHSHDIKGSTDDTPDDYFVEFAHRCIDEGVDLFVGTGTHQLKAVEIYKDKPIFYSLGNFIFADEYLKYWPYDFTEKFDSDYDISSSELWNLRSKNQTTGLEFDVDNYRSIIPVVEFVDGCISKISLVPIELDFNNKTLNKGYPHIASLEEGKTIYNRLKSLSKEFNTNIKYDGRFIEIIL